MKHAQAKSQPLLEDLQCCSQFARHFDIHCSGETFSLKPPIRQWWGHTNTLIPRNIIPQNLVASLSSRLVSYSSFVKSIYGSINRFRMQLTAYDWF